MKVAVFGSCVSRDAFAMYPVEGIEVAEYMARSSLASAFQLQSAPKEWLDRLMRIESTFQRRMVDIDMSKRAADILLKSEADVVLVDMIDERFRLVRQGQNGYATWSSEFGKLELPVDEFDEVLGPLDADRMLAWEDGAKILIRSLMPRRLVINRAFWSESYTDGTELPNQQGISQANQYLKAMYDDLERMALSEGASVSVITYPKQCVRADAEHKWGESPFHYVQKFYEHTMHSLTKMRACVNGR